MRKVAKGNDVKLKAVKQQLNEKVLKHSITVCIFHTVAAYSSMAAMYFRKGP